MHDVNKKDEGFSTMLFRKAYNFFFDLTHYEMNMNSSRIDKIGTKPSCDTWKEHKLLLLVLISKVLPVCPFLLLSPQRHLYRAYGDETGRSPALCDHNQA